MVGLEYADDHADGGGLTGAVGSEESERFPGADFERDIVDSDKTVELFAQVRDFYHALPRLRFNNFPEVQQCLDCFSHIGRLANSQSVPAIEIVEAGAAREYQGAFGLHCFQEVFDGGVFGGEKDAGVHANDTSGNLAHLDQHRKERTHEFVAEINLTVADAGRSEHEEKVLVQSHRESAPGG